MDKLEVLSDNLVGRNQHNNQLLAPVNYQGSGDLPSLTMDKIIFADKKILNENSNLCAYQPFKDHHKWEVQCSLYMCGSIITKNGQRYSGNCQDSVSRHSSEMSANKVPVWRLVEISVAEVLGTALLVFFGCMSMIGTAVPPLQPALAFGMIVASIVQVAGHISESHLNPSVTLCAVILRRMNAVTALVYVLSECLGGILGIGLLNFLTPCDLWQASAPNGTVCVTLPAGNLEDMQALGVEFASTFLLVLMVCSVWDERNVEKLDSVPLKFGVVVTLLAMVAGPYTGASLNPARSLGPAFLSGNFHKHWIYWIGPLSGSAVASIFYKTIFLRKQASPSGGRAEEVPLRQT